MERAPSAPAHLGGRIHGERVTVLGAAPGTTQHLRPERRIGHPLVHHQVVVEEQARDSELGPPHGRPIENHARPGQRTVGNRQRGRQRVEVHDLVPPQDVVRYGDVRATDLDANDAIGVTKIGGRGPVYGHQGRIAERRNPVSLNTRGEDLLGRDAANQSTVVLRIVLTDDTDGTVTRAAGRGGQRGSQDNHREESAGFCNHGSPLMTCRKRPVEEPPRPVSRFPDEVGLEEYV